MTTTAPQPAQIASQEFNEFLAHLPPDTPANVVGVVRDFAAALKWELDDAIAVYGPHTIIVGGPIRSAMQAVTNSTIDNAVNALAAKLEKAQ